MTAPSGAGCVRFVNVCACEKQHAASKTSGERQQKSFRQHSPLFLLKCYKPEMEMSAGGLLNHDSMDGRRSQRVRPERVGDAASRLKKQSEGILLQPATLCQTIRALSVRMFTAILRKHEFDRVRAGDPEFCYRRCHMSSDRLPNRSPVFDTPGWHRSRWRAAILICWMARVIALPMVEASFS